MFAFLDESSFTLCWGIKSNQQTYARVLDITGASQLS
jgi:hypothetical protein